MKLRERHGKKKSKKNERKEKEEKRKSYPRRWY